ncbi:unnamed protein product, partial [marine sediment metagenome]
MTFEIYEKGAHSTQLTSMEIRVRKVSISFGSEICKD